MCACARAKVVAPCTTRQAGRPTAKVGLTNLFIEPLELLFFQDLNLMFRNVRVQKTQKKKKKKKAPHRRHGHGIVPQIPISVI